jgi:hypothetical protein
MARRPHQKNTANLLGQGVGRGDATNSGLACQPEVRGPEQAQWGTRPFFRCQDKTLL